MKRCLLYQRCLLPSLLQLYYPLGFNCETPYTGKPKVFELGG